jgi:hypothetical protein
MNVSRGATTAVSDQSGGVAIGVCPRPAADRRHEDEITSAGASAKGQFLQERMRR